MAASVGTSDAVLEHRGPFEPFGRRCVPGVGSTASAKESTWRLFQGHGHGFEEVRLLGHLAGDSASCDAPGGRHARARRSFL